MDDIKIKIERPPGISREEAEMRLYKALSFSIQGKSHVGEFEDPAMQDLVVIMKKLHAKTIENIIKEVSEVLDKEKF